MAKCSDVTILATSYFTRNVFGKCLPILYKNRSPGKSKQNIHLIFSVFVYSNIVERINEVLKKIGNRPETAKSAPSPFHSPHPMGALSIGPAVSEEKKFENVESE